MADASVGLALVLREPLSPSASRLFELAATGRCVCVAPDLFLVECAHVLRKRVVGGMMTADDAVRRVSLLLSQQIEHRSIGRLACGVLDAALAWCISAYDASYAVLGMELDAPLVTADQRLARALQAAGRPAVHLGERAA